MGGSRIIVKASTTPTANKGQEQHKERERTTTVSTDGADSSEDSIEFVCTRLLEKHGILNENALPHLLSLLVNPSTRREQFDFIKNNVQEHLMEIDSGGGFFASLVEGMVFSISICQDLNALFQEHLKLYPSTALWSENLKSFHNYLCALLVFGGSKRLSGRLNSVDDDDSRRSILNRPIHLSRAEVGMVLANALGNQNVKLEFLLSGKKAEAMRRDDLVQEDFRTKAINARTLMDRITSCYRRFTAEALEQDQTISPQALRSLQSFLVVLLHCFDTIQDFSGISTPGSDTAYFINMARYCKEVAQRNQYIKLTLKAKSTFGGLFGARRFFEKEINPSKRLSPEGRSLAIEQALQKLERMNGKDDNSSRESHQSTSRFKSQQSTSRFESQQSTSRIESHQSTSRIESHQSTSRIESHQSTSRIFVPAAELPTPSSSISIGLGNKVRNTSPAERLGMIDQIKNKKRNKKKNSKKAGEERKLNSADEGGKSFSSLFKALGRSLVETGSRSNSNSSAQDRGEGSSSQVQQHPRNAPSTEQARKRPRSSISTFLLGSRNRTNSQDQNDKDPDSSNESIKPQRSKPKLSLDNSLKQSHRLPSDK